MSDEGTSEFAQGAIRRGDSIVFAKADIHQSIPRRFEQQVEAYPDRLAVKDGSRTFTYRRLNEESNKVARTILEMRGKGEEPIALLFDQGIHAVVAILGILKAGKFYVALPPSATRPELEGVLSDCQPGLIVTNGTRLDLARRLTNKSDGFLNIDEIGETVENTNPIPELNDDRLAYIFYTSGTTGSPKGVFDSHINVLHNIMRYTNSLNIDHRDRISLIQSCNFSGTVSSLLCALLNGASVFPFDLRNKGIEKLAKWVEAEGLTVFHAVPMIFEQLIDGAENLASLRLVRLEGDQAHQRQITLFQRNFPRLFNEDCLLVNGLGTTETGLVRQFFVGPHSTVSSKSFPIGYPVDDTEICLLDENGDEVGAGEIGEITVISDYLARGYWRRPDLTKSKFLTYSGDSKPRAYLTGDLGRASSEGCLEYLGRKDLRVKLRGQWLDVTDIEAALCALSTVKHALVMVREDKPGRQKSFAYIVPATDHAPTVTELRRALSAILPSAMIPARFVFLEQLPLTDDGKVDRRHLPSRDRQRPHLDQPFVAPRTADERGIADCFAEVLEIDDVGLNDDFFDLGGDSLLATEVLLLIEERLNFHCPTEVVLESGSVGEVARRLMENSKAGCLVPLNVSGSGPPLFCMANYFGHVVEYVPLARLLRADRPVYGLESRVLVQDLGPDARVEDIASAFLSDIQRVQPRGPYFLCGNCFGGVVAFEVAQRLRRQGDTVSLLALIDTAFPGGPAVLLWRRLNVFGHWRNFANLPMRGKAAYLGGKTMEFGKFAMAITKFAIRWGATRFLSTSQRTPTLSRAAIAENHRFAEVRYRPAVYDGDITVFCPGPPQNQSRWRDVAGGRIDFVQIPVEAAGDTMPHLVQEPAVGALARHLSAALRKRKGPVKGAV
jgi:amino acid adenylation domain-containing protein